MRVADVLASVLLLADHARAVLNHLDHDAGVPEEAKVHNAHGPKAHHAVNPNLHRWCMS